MNIAVLQANYGGGAARVSQTIAELFDAPIYYCNEKETIPDHIDSYQILQSPLVELSEITQQASYYLFLRNLKELTEYDVIIQSGNEFNWYYPPDEQVLIRYIHSPPRSIYDLSHTEKPSKTIGKIKYYTEEMQKEFFRMAYSHTVPYADVNITNSELVQYRLTRATYLEKDDTEIVYPPTDTNLFSRPQENEIVESDSEKVFVTFGRLVAKKKVDEIIDVFKEYHDDVNNDSKLWIIGKGEEREKLEERAEDYDSIEFLGYLTDEGLVRHVSAADAMIFNAKNEDFGLAPLESLSLGVPVLGVEDGFTKEQIVSGWNGFTHNSKEDLLRNMKNIDDIDGTYTELHSFVEQFSKERFEKEIFRVVRNAYVQHENYDMNFSQEKYMNEPNN